MANVRRRPRRGRAAAHRAARRAGRESDEITCSGRRVDAVKVRDDLLDVKHLEEIDDDGLQLWAPVMKAPLPVSAGDARAVLAALGVPVPALEGGTSCSRRSSRPAPV